MAKGAVVGEIYHLRCGTELIDPDTLPGTAYAESIAGEVVPKLDGLGMDEAFQAILGESISHLTIVARPSQRASFLNVEKVFPQGKGRGVWQRQANISPRQLSSYQELLLANLGTRTNIAAVAKAAIGQVIGLNTKVDKDQQVKTFARSMALKWLMSELSIDALRNSVDMQKRFGRYIGDYSGASMIRVANDPTDVSDELFRQRAGFALETMSDDILRTGIVDTTEAAARIIAPVRSKYPGSDMRPREAVPYTRSQLEDFIGGLTPAPVQRVAGLGLAQVVSLDTLR